MGSKRLKRPLAVDLFAGAGGMSLGFEQAGFDVVAAVELDPIHCAAHEYNFPRCRTICADATRVTGPAILQAAGVEAGDIDVVFGGPPCQGFSLIGKRLADDPRNTLLFHFLRLVSEIKPNYFVMENVKGLTIGHSRSILDAFLSAAKDIGYQTVEPTRVLNAADYGVPQDRRRIFVLGYRNGCRPPTYPAPITRPVIVRSHDAPSTIELPPGPNVRDAIGDLPDIDDYPQLLESDAVMFKPAGGSRYARVLQGRLADRDDSSYPRRWESKLLTSSTRAVHTPLSKRRFAATSPGSVEPVSRFFKLPFDGISNTLRAGTPSNRGAFTSPRPIHPKFSRCISVREAARLHSYPDWFRFHVTKWHGFRQIGNSVPPLLARAVGARIASTMAYVPTKPRERLSLGAAELLHYDMTEAANRYGVSASVIEPRTRVAASIGRR